MANKGDNGYFCTSKLLISLCLTGKMRMVKSIHKEL